MSKIYSASQYDKSFSPKRLGNWEIPASKGPTTPAKKSPKASTPDKKPLYIVDDKGHLLPTVKKISNAFNTELPVYQHSPHRWPEQDPVAPAAARATMGYKGIQTDYLPASTVPVKTVEVAGCKERKYQ